MPQSTVSFPPRWHLFISHAFEPLGWLGAGGNEGPAPAGGGWAPTEGEPQMQHSQRCSPASENGSVYLCPKAWVQPTFTLAAKARVVITGCLFVVAACNNSAVFYSVSRKRQKSHVQRLIRNLAAADLLVTVTVMPLDAAWNVTVQWYAGDALCRFLNFLKLFAMYSAALVLVVISLDRHAAIVHPLSFASSSRRNRMMLCIAWTLSLLLASPQLFLFHLHTIPGVNFTQCVTHGSFKEHWQETTYNMFTFASLYVTPLCVMIICYTRILAEISKQLKINQGEFPVLSLRARMKTLKMTIVIVASFIICWTPYYLLGLWYWFQPDMIHKMPEYIGHFLFLFGLLHTCTDPIIYGLYTPSFREDMRLCLGTLKLTLTHTEKALGSVSEMNNKDSRDRGQAPSSASSGAALTVL
uniref:Type II GnRH receptor n=1 Tax=Varanus komodoensis TaxID=61221 RepID=A0A8D2LS90_VARKO